VAFERERIATTSENNVEEGRAGFCFENTTHWTDKFRTIAGLRHDRYRFGVSSNIIENSGNVSSSITPPKLSLTLGPWAKTELFLNYGEGFHSNDAHQVGR
jgi:outer membrane receptor protein involved in Fe transport